MNKAYIIKELEEKERTWAFTSAERAVKFILNEGWDKIEFLINHGGDYIQSEIEHTQDRPADLARWLKQGFPVRGVLGFSGMPFMIEPVALNPEMFY